MNGLRKRVLCFLLIAAMLMPFTGCGKEKNTVAGETELSPEPADLVLTISEDLFLLDKQTILEIQVTCQEAVTEDVRIKDETGTIIALLENDGSGSLRTQIPFRRSTIGTGSLTAYVGEFTSEPVGYEVQPEVTEEMVETLFDTSQELGEFVSGCSFEDPYSAEALKKVKKYLEGRNNVCSVEENNGILLYQTTDGLMGSYGMGRSEDACLGFSNATEVYKDWLSQCDISKKYIDSPVAPTSDRCLIVSPDYGDAIISNSTEVLRLMVSDSFEEITFTNEDSARECLAKGEFTDCGMLFLVGHGTTIKRADSSDMLFIGIGSLENETDCISYLNSVSDGFQMLWRPTGQVTEDCYAAIGTSVDENNNTLSALYISTLFLEKVLEGKTFDNTVVYLNICFALKDSYFVNLLLEHGASMVIGCHDALDIFYSFITVYEMCAALRSKNAEGSFGKYHEGVDNVSLESITDFLEACGYSSEILEKAMDSDAMASYDLETEGDIGGEQTCQDLVRIMSNNLTINSLNTDLDDVIRVYRNFYSGYVFALEKNRYISYALRSPDHRDRVLHGEGDLTGYVMTQDGQPADGAMVTLYHWMDHTFKEYEHKAVVNANGKYEFVDVPYGVYAVEAERNGVVDYTTITIDEPEVEVKDLILNQNQLVIWGEAIWKDATSKENYSSYLVEPVLLACPNEQVVKKLHNHWAGLMDVVDTQIDVVAGNSSSGPEYSGVADLTVDSVFLAGDVLSVRMSAISYAAGQAHPWRGSCASNINITTGEEAVLRDILAPDANYTQIRSGWLSLMEHIDDQDLTDSKETIVNKAMNGELGSWSLTPDGLEIGFSPYEISSYSSYSGSTVIPYQDLHGELKDSYISASVPASHEKPTVALVRADDQRFDNADYQVWGDETNSVMAFDGTATHVSICAVNQNTDSMDDSVLFYANTLTDALIWLPECESGLYRIRWTIGDTQMTTMVEVS